MASSITCSSIYEYSFHWWNEICKTLKRAHVFIDDQAVESLHWNGGWARLHKAGVTCVSEFSPTNVGLEHEKKGVFIISGPTFNRKEEILREIVLKSHFEFCQVITSAYVFAQSCAKLDHLGETSDVGKKLEEDCLTWMGNPNYTCEVLHIPFHTLSLTHDFFMLPSFSDIFPIFNYTSADGKRIGPQGPFSINDYHASNNYQSNVEWSLDHLPCDLQFKAMEFVQALDSILQTLDVKEDIFTLGRFSKVVGEQLESLTSGKLRRKGTTRKVSIILVDRTLDMVTPCDCHFEVALDEIRASLPQFPGHEVDVRVDMKDAGYMFGNCVGGCLFDIKLNERQDNSLNDLIVKDMLSCQKSTREALKSVLNNSDDDADFNLQDAMCKFAEDPVEIEKHLHLVQRAQAMTNANCEKIIKRFEVLREIQAKFKKSMSNRQELLDNLPFLTKMIRLRRTSGISLDDILLLTTFLYALLPSDVSFFEEDEDRLQSALSEALISDQDHLSEILATIFAGQKLNEVLAYQVVKNIFVKLKALSKVKDSQNHTLKVQSQENVSESSQTSYLEKLALNLFSEDRRNIPDLQHITGGLGSMLKSGISLLGVKINTIHPRENPTIIIFVIGGITASEVRQIQQIASAKSKAKLWIGSTKMAGPWDSLRSLFIQDKR